MKHVFNVDGQMKDYDEIFYNGQKEGSLKSARKVLPILMQLTDINSVIDVGCGLGTWLSVFNELGVEDIIGMDGSWVNRERLYIKKEKFIETDLENPIEISRKFDLAMSLEVAEHLSESNAENFVKYLTNLSHMVLFSAAIPNQGGTNHINEQWPDYWINLFKKNDFYVLDWIRGQVWNDSDIEVWYRQNIFLFINKNIFNDFNSNLPPYKHFYSFVHPERYSCKIDYLNDKLKYHKYEEIALNNSINNLKIQVNTFEAQITDYNTQIEDYNTQIEDYNTQIEDYELEIEKLDYYNEKRLLGYEKKLNKQMDLVKKMENSKSWKITKPLRNMVKIIKKVL